MPADVMKMMELARQEEIINQQKRHMNILGTHGDNSKLSISAIAIELETDNDEATNIKRKMSSL